MSKNWSASAVAEATVGRGGEDCMRSSMWLLAVGLVIGSMTHAPSAQGTSGARAAQPTGQRAGGQPAAAPRRSTGAGPVIVFQTAKGTFEVETYPNEAPKSVEHVLTLV